MTSPTPRTDARHIEVQMQDLQIGHQLRELINHARQLERELNEANNTSRAMVRLHDEQEKEIEQLCEERDQLRKVADKLAKRIGCGCAGLCDPCSEALDSYNLVCKNKRI